MPSHKNGLDATTTAALGSTFLKTLDEPVLVIGTDTWNKRELAAMGVVQTAAARIVSRIVKELGVKSLADLHDRTGVYSLATTRAGVTSLYVLFAAMRSKGLNIRTWYQKRHAGTTQPETDAVIGFQGYKRREVLAESRTKKKRRTA
jgi:hypothetical protein